MTENQRSVVLSGWHSGPNPSPALGTAQSLLHAWPDLQIHALDYSSFSTGLSSALIRERHVLPSWKDADLDEMALSIVSIVNGLDALFLSGLDLETRLLSSISALPRDKFLIPPTAALEATEKPSAFAAEILELKIPRTELATSISSGVAFAESCGWPVWVKGQHYEALKVHSAASLAGAMDYLASTWASGVLIQEDLDGAEESIAFCALRGEVLSACAMRKTLTTSEGKTWGGRVRALNGREASLIGALAEEMGWTGGAEVEMVRSQRDGALYVIDLNPRFPAWIHGATLANHNLPATLVAASWGIDPPAQTRNVTPEFVRVVVEIPAMREATAHREAEFALEDPGHKGHPSEMPVLSRRLWPRVAVREVLPVLSDARASWLDAVLGTWSDTDDGPERVLFEDRLRERFEALQDSVESIGDAYGVQVTASYSMKTNPDSRVLKAAREEGLGIETISLGEVRRALTSGFPGESITLNGPGKWWPRQLLASTPRLAAINCDSIEDLEETLTLLASNQVSCRILGVRFAPMSVGSRFGVGASDARQFLDLCRLLANAPLDVGLGLHFHHALSSIGLERWLRELRAVVALAASVEQVAGRSFAVADIGGGWRGSSFATYAGYLREAMTTVGSLPGLREVVIEPGKAIVEPTMALLTRVLRVRRLGESTAAVLGAAVSDVPDSTSFPHEIWWRPAKDGRWYSLPDGGDSVHGRICMEHDIIRTSVQLPLEASQGDIVAIMDVGAYDASMSYSFGGGEIV